MVRSLFAVAALVAVCSASAQSSWKPGSNSVSQKKANESKSSGSKSTSSSRSSGNSRSDSGSKSTWKPGGNVIGNQSYDRKQNQSGGGSWRPGSTGGSTPSRPGPGVGGSGRPSNTKPGQSGSGSGGNSTGGYLPSRPGPGNNPGNNLGSSGGSFGFQGGGWRPGSSSQGGSQGGFQGGPNGGSANGGWNSSQDRGGRDGWKSTGGRPGFQNQAGISLFDSARPRTGNTDSNNVFFGDKNTDFARSPNNQDFARIPGTNILSPGIIRPNDGWRQQGWRPAQPPRNDLFWNGYRCGYYHYRPNWHNGYFFYSSYTYYPVAEYVIVPSPWYYYFSLPPYLHGNHIVYGQNWRSGFNGTPYFWGNSRELDRTIEDVIEIFRTGDSRLAGAMVPRRGQVAILLDDRYLYSMQADGFLDLFLDGVMNNRTTSYWVENVWENRNEAKLVARHEYLDPWGRLQRTYHTYYLELERGQFVIRAFGVSR